MLDDSPQVFTELVDLGANKAINSVVYNPKRFLSLANQVVGLVDGEGSWVMGSKSKTSNACEVTNPQLEHQMITTRITLPPRVGVSSHCGVMGIKLGPTSSK